MVMALTASGEVELSLSEAPLLDKRKGKQLIGGPSKKYKKKTGEMSSAFLSFSNMQTEL